MKKISRKDLQGLRQQFPVLTKELMQSYVGGLAESYLDHNWLFSDPDFTDFGINMRSSSGYGGGGGAFGGNPYGYTDGNLNLPPMDDYYPVNGGMLDEVTIYGNKPYNPTVPNKPDIPYSYPEIPDKLDPINPNPKPKPDDEDDYPGPSYYYDDWGNNGPSGGGLGWGGYPGLNWPYIGGYYSYGNYGSGGSGGGGGSWEGDSSTSDSRKDGINLDNSQHFWLKIPEYTTFRDQLTEILKSNSVLKSILGYFVNGYASLTFSISDLESGAIATTRQNKDSSYAIVLNQQYVDKNGWKLKYLKEDNIGYDWTKVKNEAEGLVVTLTHESIHASHYARYQDALRITKNSSDKAAQWLLDNGYSKEFVEIFFKEDGYGGWYDTTNLGMQSRMHTYMQKYDHVIIDQALTEYRREH